jgi:hypothetical protein
MIERSITMKVEPIFEALKWDLSTIKEVKIKKVKEAKVKCLVKANVLSTVDITKNETFSSLEEKLKNIQIHVR